MGKCHDRHSGFNPSIALCRDDRPGLIDKRSTDPIHVIGDSGINPEDRSRDLRKFMDSSYSVGVRGRGAYSLLIGGRDPARSTVSR
jgi:hypothetical protein